MKTSLFHWKRNRFFTSYNNVDVILNVGEENRLLRFWESTPIYLPKKWWTLKKVDNTQKEIIEMQVLDQWWHCQRNKYFLCLFVCFSKTTWPNRELCIQIKFNPAQSLSLSTNRNFQLNPPTFESTLLQL